MTCPLMFDREYVIVVNGQRVYLDFKLSCRDSHVIYLAQCTVCNVTVRVFKEDSYFGQTVTALNTRFNGHRSCFVISSDLLYEKSALSMHCFLQHKGKFDLNLFKLGLVKKVTPILLDREESVCISKYQTDIWGLNRIAVVR